MEPSCGICGRTILAGERVHAYAGGGDRQTVCELCVAGAERLGWRPGAEPEDERGQEHEGRRRLRRLWRPRRAPARHRPPPPIADEEGLTPFERAVARFDSSEAGRAVAGLTRTLGVPRASVGASAGAPDLVRVTVAWDLSWYQWGVDVADELRSVFELGKGSEVDQLDAAAKQWNAAVGEDGRLRLAGDRVPGR
jgi:hypothetical protein